MGAACAVFIFAIILFVLYRRWYHQKKESHVCLVGKTALVTGAARGIGFYTALELAARGCRVIIADILEAEEARKSIIRQTNNPNVVFKRLNLASLESVRKFAKEINETEDRLDILINNAGIGSRPPQKTEDGLDLIMQTNYFGAFLLTHLLSDLLKKSAPSRIIFVSSILSWLGKVGAETLNGVITHKQFLVEDGMQLYSNSKLCAIIAADGFAERLGMFNVTSIPVRPFFASLTPILEESKDNYFNFLNLRKILMNSVPEYPWKTAKHIVYTSIAQELAGTREKFFTNSRECWKPFKAKNKKLRASIWAASEELVGLKPDEKITLFGPWKN